MQFPIHIFALQEYRRISCVLATITKLCLTIFTHPDMMKKKLEVFFVATSAEIQESILRLLDDENNHNVQDIKNYIASEGIEVFTEGQFAGSINTLLRNGSIDKIDRGIYAIKRKQDFLLSCFVVSPIGGSESDTRVNADKLYKHIIKPICEECCFEAVRVDQINDSNSITETILEQLETADLVIADITEHNPNVFYEIGYRTRTKKPIIYLKRKGEVLPFDINTIRTFEYDLTDLDSVDEIKSRLAQTIKSFGISNMESNQHFIESAVSESALSSMMPLMYQILDSMDKLQKEVRNNNNDIIQTIVKAMQNSQPQMSAEVALQTQLLGAFLENPDGMMKLAEAANKLPPAKNKQR
jgi:nucleoside 2-deoxyribosyltransferase